MRLLHLSDTHGQHEMLGVLPKAVVVHSGDFMSGGSKKEVLAFIKWFAALPYAHKIFIAGNHDDYLYGATIEGLPDNTHYLCHSSITIDGLTFYGIPLFMRDVVDGLYEDYLLQASSDTNVLITHQPPMGVLDVSDGIQYGNALLLKCVQRIKPQYHIHASYGVVKQAGTVFSNGSLVNNRYELTNKARVYEF